MGRIVDGPSSLQERDHGPERTQRHGSNVGVGERKSPAGVCRPATFTACVCGGLLQVSGARAVASNYTMTST